MSPFLRKVRTASGATAVQIVSKSGGVRRIVEHLGSAHDETEVAALLEAGRQKIAAWQGQGLLDLESLDPAAGRTGLVGATVVESKRSGLLWDVLHGAYTRLGLGDATGGDRAFEQMVLARLIEPTSKAQVPRVLGDLGLESVSVRTLFRSLGRCVERGYRESLSGALFDHVTASGGLALCLYDVTTLYFEAEREDDLRKVGYSKERRADPQVIVGLLVDRAGFPLQVGCWEGNKAETTTIVPIVEAFQAAYGIEELVVVADVGMLSAANLAALDEARLRFIVAGPAPPAPRATWRPTSTGTGTPSPTGRSSTPSLPSGARGASGTRAARPSRCGTRSLTRARGGGWVYSKKRAARDNQTLTAQANRARAVIAGEKRPKGTRFVTIHQGDQVLDEASIARARSLVGLKGYVTNIPARLMDAGEVVSSYHELWHVEQSFRMSKHDLRARPVFHHTRDAIEAHLTVVMAALAVARYLQDVTGISIKHVIRALKPLQDVTINLNGHQITAKPQLTQTAAGILKSLKPSGH